jgi:pimeloyl-ACP methyl ester carboxylesterase
MDVAMKSRQPDSPPLAVRGESTGQDGLQLVHDRWRGTSGTDILYLHGFGQTRQAWTSTAQRLVQTGFGGLAVDGRGHGESQWNPPERRYSMDQFIHDTTLIAQRAFERPPVLVGASMGGLLGLLTEGESATGLYSALVLVDVTPRWEAQGVERILDFMSAHPEGFADLEHAADEIASYLPHRRRRKSPAELASLLVRRADGRWRWHWDPRMLDEVAREGERYQPRLIEAAARVRIPTLLISGGLSDLVSDATVDEFLAAVPHATHVRIADATHMVAGDRNDAFTGAILEFLTTLHRAPMPGRGAPPGADR